MAQAQNWRQVTADLIAAGWTEQDLAQQCQCAQADIQVLVTNTSSDPAFSVGTRLLELLTFERGENVVSTPEATGSAS